MNKPIGVKPRDARSRVASLLTCWCTVVSACSSDLTDASLLYQHGAHGADTKKQKQMAAREIKVGILGSTGAVGQNFIRLLEGHPFLRVAVLGASDRSAGQVSHWTHLMSFFRVNADAHRLLRAHVCGGKPHRCQRKFVK